MPLPASLTTITVTGTFLRGDGEFETGYIEFANTVHLVSTTDDTIISPIRRRVQLASGAFSVTLPATNDPQWEPVDYTWQVTHQFGEGGTRQYSVALPYDGGDKNIADLIPVEASSGSASGSGGGVQSVNGDPGPDVVITASGIGAAAEVHTHGATDVVSGTMDVARLPVGTGASEVAAGDHSHAGAGATLHMAPEPGCRWYLTDDPFDGAFLAQLDTGDMFSYPDGHASERETYRWNGTTWVFLTVLDDVPAAASFVVASTTHTHAGADIASGTVATARLDTGTGGTQVALGNHGHGSDYAALSHVHAGADITTGTVSTSRLDTGTSGSQVALGDHTHAGVYANATHTHAAADTTSGSFDIARIPTGTSSSTVSLGNHTHAGSWSDATLGTNVSAGTSVNPGTRLEGDRVFMRGNLAWTSATLNAGHVLMTVAVAHRPASAKRFPVRTSATSNISCVLNLATNGQLTNTVSFGSSTTADCPIDGFNYELS